MELTSYLGKDVGYNEVLKKKFALCAKRFAKNLAGKMGFKEYKVSYNPGGIAVSGDVTLMGMYNDEKGVYLHISTPILGKGMLMFRTISHMRDYSGGANQWFDLSKFESVDKVAEHIKRTTK